MKRSWAGVPIAKRVPGDGGRLNGKHGKNPGLEELSFVGLWLVVLFVSLDLLYACKLTPVLLIFHT